MGQHQLHPQSEVISFSTLSSPSNPFGREGYVIRVMIHVQSFKCYRLSSLTWETVSITRVKNAYWNSWLLLRRGLEMTLIHGRSLRMLLMLMMFTGRRVVGRDKNHFFVWMMMKVMLVNLVHSIWGGKVDLTGTAIHVVVWQTGFLSLLQKGKHPSSHQSIVTWI